MECKTMDPGYFFNRNLLALSAQNPDLCSRLSLAQTTLARYKFLDSVTGKTIPAIVDRAGTAHPLHSTVDPEKEAARLVSSLREGAAETAPSLGFLVFLGLGGAYAPEAALNSGAASHVLVIDYDIDGIAELFCSREYIAVLGDPRFTLLVDPSPEQIESAILELYRPAFCGGIRALPLRARTEQDKNSFGAATETIQRTIEKVSSDYSVQAYFGTRWFSNIIRNLAAAQAQNRSAAPIREAAIIAAGPSLDMQIAALCRQKETCKENLHIIAADTALPALLQHGIKPDAVVSIDCQHISYYHFAEGASAPRPPCRDIPLFLDIASPPMLSGFSDYPFFFTGGHPLAVYISQKWRPLPVVDTSGGNVAYACLSLAQNLGAQRITVYGADFSYPEGKVYARGTYIHPFFERKQKRFLPTETQLYSFLNRDSSALKFYRTSFEQKISTMEAEVIAVPGLGIPLAINSPRRFTGEHKRIFSLFAPGKALMSAADFLRQYRQEIAALPPLAGGNAGSYMRGLTFAERQVFVTLLPQAAALKRRSPGLSNAELLETVKNYCITEIDRVLRISC
jgi:hypothetical protein